MLRVASTVTVKLTAVLDLPLTVTTTLPVPAATPAGTCATICVLVQERAGILTPLRVTALLPSEATTGPAPKFVPVIVTNVPTGPEVGERLVMAGGDCGLIVNDTLFDPGAELPLETKLPPKPDEITLTE